ncbi:MAG: dipeptidase [Gemmatimonadota bacterium]
MTDIAAYLETNRARFESELADFLRIPSVSTLTSAKPALLRCAEYVAARIRDAGVDKVEVVPTEGNPIVVAEQIVSSDAPTLLVYGHYDVQPSDPEHLWTAPPFEPEVRDGRMYARGAIDDKGQVHMHIKALEARLKSGAGLPVNTKLVIEGEEEIGSRNLEAFLHAHSDRLSCDAVVISDTGMLAADCPSIGMGLRGIAYLEVSFRGPATDLHSGSYGGAVVNPANALAATIARLKDERGRVTIPGFYDRVRPITEEEREQLRALPFDDEQFRTEVGAPALGGEAGYSTLERLWYRPTLDVNGMLSGWTGEGSKTVLPSKATAKISMRLVPDQDPTDIAERFRAHIEALAPAGVEVEVKSSHGGEPWAADPQHPIFDAAAAALEAAFGKKPVYIREGGSIPIVPMFERTFDAPVLLLGFALPGCNAHAPDEWIDLRMYARGIETIAQLYDEVAARRLRETARA